MEDEEHDLLSAPGRVSMVELEDVAGGSDADDDSSSALIRGSVVEEEDSCCFVLCFPCSDVAVSATRLKMRRQGLSRLPSALFSDRLVLLDLSHNRLAALSDALAALVSLRRLAASHNELTHVHPAVFALPQLRQLDLAHNRLPMLHRDLLLLLPQLETLDLANNPIAWPPAALSSGEGLRAWARKYQAPPAYRFDVGRGAYLDASYHTVYYLGPGEKDEDRHEIVAALKQERVPQVQEEENATTNPF